MKLVRLGVAVAAVAIMSLASVEAWAIDEASLPKQKQTMAKLYLGADEVMAFINAKQGKVLFIDVRTQDELMYVGSTPAIDANVPFKFRSSTKFDEQKGAFALDDNPNFVAQVEASLTAKPLTKDDPVVLMCRSGDRSAVAADVLGVAGFKQVYTVVDGFEGDIAKDGPNAGRRAVNGWKNKGQPWGYKLEKAKMTLAK